MRQLVWANVRVHVKEAGPGLQLRRIRMAAAARDQLSASLQAKGLEPVSETFSMEWIATTEGEAKMAGVLPDAGTVPVVRRR